MPELPEVETTLRGLSPHLIGRCVSDVVIRNPRLRWPVPDDLADRLTGCRILTLQRRAKYLLLAIESGTVLLHLGMSGSLRILPTTTPPEKHDHFDLVLDNGTLMRLRDPRRFGAVLWHTGTPDTHPLLARLGPEPLGADFDGDALFAAIRGRRCAIKLALMDQHIVVGVGNIYANEALFRSGIRPQTPSGRLSRARCTALAEAVRAILSDAIAQGGSTLRDFVHSDGKPGYFQQTHRVYGRGGQPCCVCATPLRTLRQGQRMTVYCPHCQS